MRQSETGRYHHPLADKLGADEVDRALRRMHGEVFRSWLALKLSQQERDISIWLAWLDRQGEQSSRRLREIARRLEELLPAECIDAERQLFLSDFRLVVSVMDMPDPRAVGASEAASPTGSRVRRMLNMVVGRNRPNPGP